MKYLSVLFLVFVMMMTTAVFAEDKSTKNDKKESEKSAVSEAQDNIEFDKVVVYYLHSNRRCMTCKKLEAYSQEAVTLAFEKYLVDSSLIWRVVNYEEEGNEHFAKEYKLYTQSVILSKISKDKEIEWKNLDKIWKLVGDKAEFITYVQTEVENFINPVTGK